MLDASNGGDRAAVLAHNWGGFDTNTAENFYIGEGKEFVVKVTAMAGVRLLRKKELLFPLQAAMLY